MSKLKVLVLPFLQIPSGHYQVGRSLVKWFEKFDAVASETVDILSYSYGQAEKVVSTVYLKWIQYFPGLYNQLYRRSVYGKQDCEKRFILYEILFLRHMKNLMREMDPDIIICTHALPSYMVNKIKCEDKHTSKNIVVINAYTDYFIHNFWGVKAIDYHFVSHTKMKDLLIKKGVEETKIFVSGIPVHPSLEEENVDKRVNKNLIGLITGGNLGVGGMDNLIKKIEWHPLIQYYILCGKNKQMYRFVQSLNRPDIHPLAFIESRDKMNALYNSVDFVLTKPGGVTISECLLKEKPVFVFKALPGQEKINLEVLQDLKLITKLNMNNMNEPIGSFLMKFFFQNKEIKLFQQRIKDYKTMICKHNISDAIPKILGQLKK